MMCSKAAQATTSCLADRAMTDSTGVQVMTSFMVDRATIDCTAAREMTFFMVALAMTDSTAVPVTILSSTRQATEMISCSEDQAVTP